MTTQKILKRSIYRISNDVGNGVVMYPNINKIMWVFDDFKMKILPFVLKKLMKRTLNIGITYL